VLLQVDASVFAPGSMPGCILLLNEYELWLNRGQIQLFRDIVFDRREVRLHYVDDSRWKLVKLVEACSLLLSSNSARCIAKLGVARLQLATTGGHQVLPSASVINITRRIAYTPNEDRPA
jgi:hypothetical protein